jgi:acyl-CoA thioester hydrolase
VQQNISYKRELPPAHCRDQKPCSIQRRSIRFRHEMRNGETGEVAAVCGITGVHMDREARKSAPFAEAIRRAAARLLVFPEQAPA